MDVITIPSLSTLQIKPVSTLQDLHDFVRFPFHLYAGSRFWVPPLIKEEIRLFSDKSNPLLETVETGLFMAYRNGNIVGRIACIRNLAEVASGHNHVRFGWFDVIDDFEVFSELLSVAENWARHKGAVALKGPYGFNQLDKAGLLTEGFNELGMLSTNYNFPYMTIFFDWTGFEKHREWVEYEFTVPEKIPDKLFRMSEITRQRYGIRLVDARSKKQLREYARPALNLMLESYSSLPETVPLTEKQLAYYTEKYFRFLRPEFVSFAEGPGGELLGFSVTAPSMSRAFQKARGKLFPFGFLHLMKAMWRNDRGDLHLIAVRPDMHGKGIPALFLIKTMQTFIGMGLKKAESGPELVTNHSIQNLWKDYESRIHKRRQTYIRYLG